MQQQQQYPNLQQLQGQLIQQRIARLERQQLEQQLLQQHGSPLPPVQSGRPQNHLQRYDDGERHPPRQPPVLFPPHLQRIQEQLLRHEQEELILRRALLAVHSDHSGSGNLAGPLGSISGESLLRDAAHQGLPIGAIPGLVPPPGRAPSLMPQAGDTANWEEGFASGVRSGSAGTVQAGSISGGAADGRFSFPFHGMRVLVVDDEPLCLVILERMLQRCHYQVTTCNRAQTALNMLRERPGDFDLVISDVHMPDMDGFKLLEAIGLELDLPVIMMSADGQTDVVMKGVIHGAVDYLVKPVRIEELRNLWQHVLRRRPHWGSKRHVATEVHSTTCDEDRMSSENDEYVKMSSGDEGERVSARVSQQLLHQRQATAAGAATVQGQLASGQAPASLLLGQAGPGASASALAGAMGIAGEFAGVAAGGVLAIQQQQQQVAAVQEPEAASEAGTVAHVKRKCTWGGEGEGPGTSGAEGHQKPYEVGVGGLKKARIIWDVHLHQQFVNAVKKLGVEKAVPKKILELMSVEGLTRENVASHLQKYRLYLKRLSAVADAKAKHLDGAGAVAKGGKDAGPNSIVFPGIKAEPGLDDPDEIPAVKEEQAIEPAESWEEGPSAAVLQGSEGMGTAAEHEQRPAGGDVAADQVAPRVQKDSPASSSRAPQAVVPPQPSGVPRVLPELLQPGEGPAGISGRLAEELQRHAALRAQLTSLEHNEMLMRLQQQRPQPQLGAAPLSAEASLRLGQGQSAVGAAAGQSVDGLLQQYRQIVQEKAAAKPGSAGEEGLSAGAANSELEILQRLHEQQQQLLELHQKQLQMLARLQGQGDTMQGLEAEGTAGPSTTAGNQGPVRSTGQAVWQGTADVGTLAPDGAPDQNSRQEAKAAEANTGFNAQPQYEQPEQQQEALRSAPVGSPLGGGSDTEDLFNLLWRQDSVNLDGLE